MKRLLKLNWVTTLLQPSARCRSVSVETWARIKSTQTCVVKWSKEHRLHWPNFTFVTLINVNTWFAKGKKIASGYWLNWLLYCSFFAAVFLSKVFPRPPGTDLSLRRPQRRRCWPQGGPPSCTNASIAASTLKSVSELVMFLVALQLWFLLYYYYYLFWHRGKETCWPNKLQWPAFKLHYTSYFHIHKSGWKSFFFLRPVCAWSSSLWPSVNIRLGRRVGQYLSFPPSSLNPLSALHLPLVLFTLWT